MFRRRKSFWWSLAFRAFCRLQSTTATGLLDAVGPVRDRNNGLKSCTTSILKMPCTALCRKCPMSRSLGSTFGDVMSMTFFLLYTPAGCPTRDSECRIKRAP